MAWFATVERATGKAISFGTDEPRLPDELERIPIAGPPDQTTMWDSATKSLVARPPKVLRDLLNELSDEIKDDLVLSTLTLTQRKQLLDLIEGKFGSWRYQ